MRRLMESSRDKFKDFLLFSEESSEIENLKNDKKESKLSISERNEIFFPLRKDWECFPRRSNGDYFSIWEKEIRPQFSDEIGFYYLFYADLGLDGKSSENQDIQYKSENFYIVSDKFVSYLLKDEMQYELRQNVIKLNPDFGGSNDSNIRFLYKKKENFDLDDGWILRNKINLSKDIYDFYIEGHYRKALINVFMICENNFLKCEQIDAKYMSKSDILSSFEKVFKNERILFFQFNSIEAVFLFFQICENILFENEVDYTDLSIGP